MADAISDRARMSTGGGSSERAAAATFAEYDREDDLRAAGADAPTDEGRLSESLQQKEVGVATSLQDAQVQLDNLRGSTALTSMKLEVASALHPEEEALIEGFSTAAALAMPEIQDAMKAWFPELTETFIQFMMVDEKTDEESVRSFTQDLPELLEPVVMSLFKMCLPIMETQVADLVEAQLEKVTEPDIVNTVVYATDEIEKSLKDIKRLQHEINGVMTEYAALKTPQPESKTAAAEARVRKETLEQDVKIINQMRTHNKVISDTYEQEAAIIKEQELLQARDTEIRAVKKSGTATIDTESAIQYGKITDPNSANLLEKIEQDMDKDKVKVNLTAMAKNITEELDQCEKDLARQRKKRESAIQACLGGIYDSTVRYKALDGDEFKPAQKFNLAGETASILVVRQWTDFLEDLMRKHPNELAPLVPTIIALTQIDPNNTQFVPLTMARATDKAIGRELLKVNNIGREMRDAFMSANRLLFQKMKIKLGDEIKQLKGVNPIEDGRAERVINISEGDAVSFIEGTIFKHSVETGIVMDNVKAKTTLLNMYAFFELNDRTLETIVQGIESKTDYIISKGVTESWAHIIEPMMRTLARAFPDMSNWASGFYKPKAHQSEFVDDCVPHLRTLCGEIRKEGRKMRQLNLKPKFDADESEKVGHRGHRSIRDVTVLLSIEDITQNGESEGNGNRNGNRNNGRGNGGGNGNAGGDHGGKVRPPGNRTCEKHECKQKLSDSDWQKHETRLKYKPWSVPMCNGCIAAGFKAAKEGKPCKYRRKFVTKGRPNSTHIDFNQMYKKRQYLEMLQNAQKSKGKREEHAHVATKKAEEESESESEPESSSEDEPEPEPEPEKPVKSSGKRGKSGKSANEKKQEESAHKYAMKVAELEKRLELSTIETRAATAAHQKLAQENAQLNLLIRRAPNSGDDRDDGPQPRSQLRSSSARIGNSTQDW